MLLQLLLLLLLPPLLLRAAARPWLVLRERVRAFISIITCFCR